jgi:uncharacterized protein YndB with AHSA1/START domain
MNKIKIESIRKELIVEASREHAFNVFTENINLWWPRSHHIGKSPLVELVLEPKVNGRWYSRHEDGSEANVGDVQTWQPYGKLILIWQVNGDFKFDPNLITEVEVNFIPQGENKTKVEFEHRDLERLGSGGKTAQSMDEGWGMILELFRNCAQSK